MTIVPKGPDEGPAKAPWLGLGRLTVSDAVYLLFCFELGTVLLAVPWTLLWDNNYFFSLQPEQSRFWLSNHLRGAVSGLGLINLWMGCSRLAVVIRKLRQPA